jgi:hypothetical protein
MKPDDIITTVIAGKILGVSSDYIRRLCIQGKIKARKVSREWLFTVADIAHIKPRKKKDDGKC